MTREQYDTIEAVNFSSLKHILRSPAHYIAARQKPDDEDETKFAVGKLTHAMVLEGKNLIDLYAIKPEGMRFSTKEGKAWREEQTKPILTSEQAASVPAMAEAIASDKEASQIMRACQRREEVITGEIGGVPMKAMLDACGADVNGLVGFTDIKTTTDARPHAFAKKCDDLHYDMQFEIYAQLLAMKEGLEGRPWSPWIVVETAPPHAVMVYYPSAKMQESGRRKLDRALQLFTQCKASGDWPGYARDITELDPPAYRIRDLE